jgi:hypothetical protein
MPGHHHHHGHHHHGSGRRFGRAFDVVYVNEPDYCPPGWTMLPDGLGGWICRPIPSLQSAAGAGDIVSNMNDLAPTIAAVKLAWQNFDGRPFGKAVLDAYARAASKAWKNDLASRADLIALCVSSALNSRAIDDGTPIGTKAANILANTWTVLAKKTGWQGQTADDVRKQAGGTKTSIEIVLIVVAVLAMAGVYAWIVYKAAEIIETKLAIDAESDELVRLHAESQKIVDRHLENPNLPWTPEELKILQDLKDQQEGVRKQIGSHVGGANPFDPTPYLIAGGLGLAAYLFFLHKQRT